ncbi:hypothetical protein T484DRAFT_1796299 [Baffinella frigidus]|nr:hypothetical protein T484DRAFT_1796299 [Cryptophyta sp. CCMP2293]
MVACFRILLLPLLLSALAMRASAAKYGEPCASDMECESSDGKTAHCYIFFVDRTTLNGVDPTPPRTFGKCVECNDDCDCGVNQRCGIPTKKEDQVMITSGSPPFYSPTLEIPAQAPRPTWLKETFLNFGLPSSP